MYKMSKLAAGSVIAAAAAVGGANVALADGYAAKPAAVERPADWSGVYFGVGSGYQWSGIDVANPLTAGLIRGAAITSDHDEAFVSAHMGVQQQWGSIVLGIEGGWMSTLRDRDGSHDFCNTPVLVLPVLGAGDFCQARLQDILTIGGRAGWAAGHWMPYITGGYANAAVDFDNRIPSPGAAGAAGATILVEEAHTRLGGWYIGGGFEWTISPGWTTGIEYRHYEFENRSTTAGTGCTPPLAVGGGVAGCPFAAGVPVGSPLEVLRFGDTTDTISARVTWRWGRPEAAAPLK
jgi:opacity protein-like surface antigen